MRSQAPVVSRLLVIDDEPPTLRSLRRLLQRRVPDWEVQTCNDPREALRCIAEFRPHIVLVDYTMPKISGDELCRAICQEEYPWKPRVFGMSGQACEPVAQMFFAAGADKFFRKPLDVSKLLEALSEDVSSSARDPLS